jgi:(E)-4-hydroxy-3-methyl-but-2-enyl pyrophosphate reductase
VDRAVITVEKALDTYGPPIYVRKQIVHNRHVVENLEQRGAIFVEELEEVPEGSTVVFSAHGVSPAVQLEAKARGLKAIDATCPLVTKVHHEAKRFAKDDLEILLIGHAGHEEVEGTTGEAPEHITLVQSPADVDELEVRDPSRLAWLSQTTLSVDETLETVNRLAMTSAMPPRTGSLRSNRLPLTATSSSLSARQTPLTQYAWLRWRSMRGQSQHIESTMQARSIPHGWRVLTRWG